MQIDLKGIAQGVIKNNMGVGRIELRVRGKVESGTVTLADTGQKLPVAGGPAVSSRPWLVFDTQGWQEGEALVLAWKGEEDAPSVTAAPAGTTPPDKPKDP